MKISFGLQSKAATTLPEVVISTAILGIMAAGIIGAFNYGFYLTQSARENQRATQIMLEKVETIRLYRWDQVNSNGFIPATVTELYNPQGSAGNQGFSYTCNLSISDVPFTVSTGYNTNMKRLTVSLSWTGAKNITRSRSVTTYVARDGLQNYVY